MIIEVESNPNCEQSFFARFKDVGRARLVTKVKSYERRSEGEWCWVTGWCDDQHNPLCPAHAQIVEDSGAGVTILVYGGIGGIRLRPVSLEEEWRIESPNQWGEPYLSFSDQKDVVYLDESNEEGS